MQIVPESDLKISQIIDVLNKGGLVIFPCETTYGAAVDATNTEAVAKLTSYKQRPFGKPYSIAVTDPEMAEKYVELNSSARQLYSTFLPGPMTVISTSRHVLASGVESETGTLGIRISSYPLVSKIVSELGKPITATSANASYQKRPYKISDILDHVSEKQKRLIDLIIDAGELPHNEPSTVIDTTLDDPAVLRQGDIKLKDNNEVLSRSEENTKNIAKELWQKYESFQGQRPIIFALVGEMGAGKTQFTKGLGQTMGLSESEIVSPTYNFHEDYGQLQHIDAWRMNQPQDLNSLGFAKMLSDKTVISVEWADRVADIVRQHNSEAVIIWVKIQYGKAENERLISWGAL